MKTIAMEKTNGMSVNVCFIKKEFLGLQQRMEQAMKNLYLNAGSETNYNQMSSVKKNILQEARILSKDILETHDRKADCACFLGNTAKEDSTNSYAGDQKSMLEHLNTLTKHLGQLEPQPNNSVKQNSSQARITSTKPLNPLSKCFVPSAKIYRMLANPNVQHQHESKHSPEVEESEEVPVNTTEEYNLKFDSTDTLSSHENLQYVLPSKIKYLWKGCIRTLNLQVQYPSLLTCFYGLNRHASALRPTVRLRQRPRKFTSIWSVRPDDNKLFNKRAVDIPCGCPPSFGYNVPPRLFGNPFNLNDPCYEPDVHLSCYPNVLNNDDEQDIIGKDRFQCALTPADADFWPDSSEPLQTKLDQPSIDQSEKDREARLDDYKKAFENCLLEICGITKKIENLADIPRARSPVPKNKTSFADQEPFCNKKYKPSTENEINSAAKMYHTADGGVSSIAGVQDLGNSWNDSQKYMLSTSRCADILNTQQICHSPCSIWCSSYQATEFSAPNRRQVCPPTAKILQSSKAGSPGQNFNLKNGKRLILSQHEGPGSVKKNFNHIFKVPSSSTSKKTADVKKQNTVLQNGPSQSANNSGILRLRHDSGDSGYSSVEHHDSEFVRGSNFVQVGPSTYTLRSCYSCDTSCPGYDTNVWTALPECIPEPTRKGTFNKYGARDTDSERLSFRIKKPRVRQEPQNFKEQGGIRKEERRESNISRERQKNKLSDSNAGYKQFSESDFPALR